ncbi:hypothetical protein NT6N_25240 [Oceaniferula spumae]|uniref:Uncharacterized protein n=1 Tax=Oceaniferula spumae TaxID=2979115 RepID=A0AAT9FNF7_9BACT
MRGSPIFQTVVLLLAMLVAGLLGKSYLDHSHQLDKTKAAPKAKNHDATNVVEGEVEMVFSSAPLSYTLRKSPIDSDGAPEVLLKGDRPEENPIYGEIRLDAHSAVTYWLDVIWAEEPAEGSRHFVQFKLSPNYGNEIQVAFSTAGKKIEQAFDKGNLGGEGDE